MAVGPSAFAGESPRCDVWLVNTRQAAHCDGRNLDEEPIGYYRLDDDHCWQPSTLDALLTVDMSESAPLPTVVFIHGNRETTCDSITSGDHLRQVLLEHGDCGDCPDFRDHAKMGLSPSDATHRRCRLILWSWPSTRVGRRARPDVQIKAAYTPQQSHYLAQYLTRIDPRTDVCLVGYSFGARIAAGSLQLLGGGEVGGRGMSVSQRPKRMGAVLVAGAFASGGLSSCGGFDEALDVADHVTVTRNLCDPVLKYYPRLYGRGGPEAIGYVGPSGATDENLSLLDVTCCVGKSHSWFRYIATPSIRQAVIDCTFGADCAPVPRPGWPR